MVEADVVERQGVEAGAKVAIEIEAEVVLGVAMGRAKMSRWIEQGSLCTITMLCRDDQALLDE